MATNLCNNCIAWRAARPNPEECDLTVDQAIQNSCWKVARDCWEHKRKCSQNLKLHTRGDVFLKIFHVQVRFRIQADLNHQRPTHIF